MAELTSPGTTDTTAASDCCAPSVQENCCEPSDKAACCDASAAGGSCGCSAAASAERGADELRETVRERYAAAALATNDPTAAAGCCADGAAITDDQVEQFGASLYADGERDELPDTAVLASLGCGNPTAVAELHEGETVLDLGSGGGIDVLLSARRVGPTGIAYGLDMTEEMLELAKTNQTKAGMENVHWLKGQIESIPSRPRRSTSCSPTASSTSRRTSPASCARPHASSSPVAGSPSRTSSPTPTWTTARAPTSRSTSAASPARSHARNSPAT
jgi:arsenite methyltransferase